MFPVCNVLPIAWLRRAGEWMVLACLPTLGAVAQQGYDFELLGSPPAAGVSIYVTGLNNAGHVVGYVRTAGVASSSAYRMDEGRLTNLGSWSQTALDGAYASQINALGQVTGYSLVSAAGGRLPQPFLSKGERVSGQDFWGGYAQANGLNNHGITVGEGESPLNGIRRAFAWIGGGYGGYVDLGALMERLAIGEIDQSKAYAINDANQVVGQSQFRPSGSFNSEQRAVLFEHGKVVDLGRPGAGSDAAATSAAIGINYRGIVIGNTTPGASSTGSVSKGWVYAAGTTTLIEAFPGAGSSVLAINQHGQVLGYGQTGTGEAYFAYECATGALRWLDQAVPRSDGTTTKGMVGYSLSAINDLGQIVGSGTYFDGVSSARRAFLLTPRVEGNVVAGAARLVGADIRHPNGNTYDQVQLTGLSATLRADPGQVLRCSFLDPDGDIVQCEFSGPGFVTILLDPASYRALAPATKYNQPGVDYVTGRATIQIDRSTASTYLSLFSVGRATALNQSLFPAGQSYDGIADVQMVRVSGAAMGGLLLGNTRLSAENGCTGIVAPGTAFMDRIVIHDIEARGLALPSLQIGEASTLARDLGSVLLAGGDLAQLNHASLELTPTEAGAVVSLFPVTNIRSDGTALGRTAVSSSTTYRSEQPVTLLVDGSAVAVGPGVAVKELAYKGVPGAPVLYADGEKKSFATTLQTLTVGVGAYPWSLFNPEPMSLISPLVGARFRHADGVVWEAIFAGGVLQQIDLKVEETLVGQWR